MDLGPMENLIVGEFEGLVLVTQRHMETCETKGAIKKKKAPLYLAAWGNVI